MRTFVLRTLGEVEQVSSQWSSLLSTSSDASPFLSLGWVRTWWEHFGDDDELYVVVAEDREEVVGIAPMLRWSRGVGPLSVSGFAGVGQEAADYGGMLLGSEPGRSCPAILDELDRASDGRATVINLGRLRPAGDTLACAGAWVDQQDGQRRDWTLSEIATDTYPYRSLGASASEPLSRLLKRNDVRRRLRRLADEHEVALDLHEPGESAARLDEFLALHDRRWAAKDERPTGAFVSERGRSFLRDVSAELDQAGWLRISFVRVDGKPIAARYGTVMGGTYSGWKSGWDPEFQKFGPGHLVVGMLLERFEEADYTEFDFMRGAGEHKKAWASGERQIGTWQLHTPGWRGDVAGGVARVRARQRYRARFS